MSGEYEGFLDDGKFNLDDWEINQNYAGEVPNQGFDDNGANQNYAGNEGSRNYWDYNNDIGSRQDQIMYNMYDQPDQGEYMMQENQEMEQINNDYSQERNYNENRRDISSPPPVICNVPFTMTSRNGMRQFEASRVEENDAFIGQNYGQDLNGNIEQNQDNSMVPPILNQSFDIRSDHHSSQSFKIIENDVNMMRGISDPNVPSPNLYPNNSRFESHINQPNLNNNSPCNNYFEIDSQEGFSPENKINTQLK